MKKFVIIGMVFAGLMLSTASAWAKPAGMSKAEYHALMVRSDGLNQKYGLGQYSQQAIVGDKLGEVGAWAVPSTPKQVSTPIVSEKLDGLGLPATTTVASGGEGFDWNDAGIGAALAFGTLLAGVGTVLTVRSSLNKPIPH
jgi:hypothetical protein